MVETVEDSQIKLDREKEIVDLRDVIAKEIGLKNTEEN
jgi:hypothetical protein